MPESFYGKEEIILKNLQPSSFKCTREGAGYSRPTTRVLYVMEHTPIIYYILHYLLVYTCMFFISLHICSSPSLLFSALHMLFSLLLYLQTSTHNVHVGVKSCLVSSNNCAMAALRLMPHDPVRLVRCLCRLSNRRALCRYKPSIHRLGIYKL